MKRLVKFNLFFLVLFFTLTSCEISKTIDLELPSYHSRYVLLGFIGDSTIHNIYFGKTIPPYSESSDTIPNTEIKLFADNQLIVALERIDANTYGTNPYYLVDSNSNAFFKFEANLINGEKVYNKPIQRPKKVAIDSVKILRSQNNMERTIKIYFTDPLEKNYYATRIEIQKDDEYIPLDNDSYEIFSPADIFDDVSFNGKHTAISKVVEVSFNSKNNFRIKLFSITEETFQFYLSLRLNRLGYRDFYNPTFEVISNIENGTGCIGAYRSSTAYKEDN
ncbi:MAG: DUF4249 family protein [Bacteroidota bacterium]